MNIVLKVNKEVQDKMIEYYTPKKRDKQIPYVLLQADDNDTVITMYTSGKVMFQGVSADVDAMMWQEMMGVSKEEKKKKASEKSDKALLNKKKLEKLESPERGIETMFRVTLNNHTKLSQIADSKANILLSVNAIIISIALSTLIPKIDAPRNAHLVIPSFVMIMFSVACIILAIMSTRPKVSSGTFTRKEIEEKKVNLLFFGNFHKMPLEEYLWAMKEMMKDRQYLYDTMIKDLYYLGIVLNRKYKLLRLTYTVFTIGIIASVVAFVVAFRNVTV